VPGRSGDGADKEGHVVVLWSTAGELVGGGEDAVQELLGGMGAVRLVEKLLGTGDHAGIPITQRGRMLGW